MEQNKRDRSKEREKKRKKKEKERERGGWDREGEKEKRNKWIEKNRTEKKRKERKRYSKHMTIWWPKAFEMFSLIWQHYKAVHTNRKYSFFPMTIRKLCGSTSPSDVTWKGALRPKENGREYCSGRVQCGTNLTSALGCCLGNRACSAQRGMLLWKFPCCWAVGNVSLHSDCA